MTDTLTIDQPRSQAVANQAPTGMFDPAMFDHMWRVASVIAASSLVPDTLATTGTKNNRQALPVEQVKANVFLVVNQAHRWGMDPFAVIASASVVHGRLMWEGKLVAAVITALGGVRLAYHFDQGQGETLGVTVVGTIPGEATPRTISGTVSDWKTSGENSPWGKPGNWPRQLCYRGAREWGRIHQPEVMLGIYADDEIEASPAQEATTRPTLAVNPDAAPKASSPPPPQSPPASKARPATKASPPAQQAAQPDPEPEPPPPLDLTQLEAALECSSPNEYLSVIDATVNPNGRPRPPADAVAALRCAAATLLDVKPAPDVGILAALLAIASAKTTDALLDLEAAITDAAWFKGAPHSTRKAIRANIAAFETHGGLS